jgi:hypothetical protein
MAPPAPAAVPPFPLPHAPKDHSLDALITSSSHAAVDWWARGLAIAALGWTLIGQLIYWRLSGSRVQVTASTALAMGPADSHSGPVIVVRATNRGRFPAYIVGWGFVYGKRGEKGVSEHSVSWSTGPDIGSGFRLEAHDSRVWMLPRDESRAFVGETGEVSAVGLYSYVDLATGQRRFSRRCLYLGRYKAVPRWRRLPGRPRTELTFDANLRTKPGLRGRRWWVS